MANQTNKGVRVSKLRLIWTIASKDFIDGLKHRQMLNYVVMIIFLMALYSFLPILGNLPPLLVVYDPGDSEFIQSLAGSEAIQFRNAESDENLRYQLGVEDRNAIGLIVPEEFDLLARGGESLELEALIDHWVDSADQAEMKSVLEREIASVSGVPIELKLERRQLTQPESGFSLSIALGLLIVMGLMGMMFTPQLIVEEKTNRTIDALQVSPVTLAELLTAKVLVGAVYCMLLSSAVLIAYGSFVLHWWAMAGAIVCGAFFIVSIGLLLGIQMNDVRQINLWGFIIFQPLIISMILGIFEPISAGLRDVMRWIPTVAMGNAAAQSIAASVDLATYLQSILITIVWGLIFFWINSRLLRRIEE